MQGGGAIPVTGVHRAGHVDERSDQVSLPSGSCISQGCHASGVTHIHPPAGLLQQFDDHHVATCRSLPRTSQHHSFMHSHVCAIICLFKNSCVQ